MPKQYRASSADKQAVEAGRFAFSLSSEEPGQQWFGREVLSHDPKAINQQRLKAGIPLLFNHDPDKHLGLIDSYEIKNQRLSVGGIWGPSPLAQEKRADYEAGILKDSSIGYSIEHITRDQDGENPDEDDTLMVDQWTPLEGSLVTIPMDITVGQGRAASADTTFPLAVEVRRATTSPAPEPEPAPAATPAVIEVRMEPTQQPDANQIEIARRDRIMAIASDKDFQKHVTVDETRNAIATGQSADAFSEFVSRKIVSANDASRVGTAGSSVMGDLSGKDAKRYSLIRAHRYAINIARPGTFQGEDVTLEREVSDEIGKRLKSPTAGVYVPNSATRTQTAGATGAGLTALTSTIGTVTESDLIEMYRNRARVLALGASRLGGLSGLIRLPRQTGAGTAQWLSETTAVASSDVTTDFVAISPKRLSIANKYTVELLAESSVDVEGMLSRDRAKVLALAIDLAAISGPTGTASPVGVLNTNGLALITSSGAALVNGKALSYQDVIEFETQVAISNADTATMGWLVTPEVRGLLKGTPMFPNGYAMPIWNSQQHDTDGLESGPLGYKAGVTNQIPKNYGAGANLHAALFGDFSNIIVADYGASELIVDPYTGAAAGIYNVTERVLMDIELRHISAFVACETIAVS